MKSLLILNKIVSNLIMTIVNIYLTHRGWIQHTSSSSLTAVVFDKKINRWKVHSAPQCRYNVFCCLCRRPHRSHHHHLAWPATTHLFYAPNVLHQHGLQFYARLSHILFSCNRIVSCRVKSWEVLPAVVGWKSIKLVAEDNFQLWIDTCDFILNFLHHLKTKIIKKLGLCIRFAYVLERVLQLTVCVTKYFFTDFFNSWTSSPHVFFHCPICIYQGAQI